MQLKKDITEFDMMVDFAPPTQANSFPDQCIDIFNPL